MSKKKKQRLVPPADESELMSNTRKVILGRMTEDAAEDLPALAYAYKKLLKIDRRPDAK